ncbi:MAG: SoxR reducing system RseC family protein [Oscillospiraceae bacterium]|nr:SoxR reducing system RseC family protein [Oscillospiraceae bacterium]
MTQTGVVSALLPDGRVQVCVQRESACGGNCASCNACIGRNDLSATAENHCGAKVGDRVTLSSRTSTLIGAAALVYLVPLLTLLGGYALSSAFGAAEGLSIAVSIACLLLGCGAVVWLSKRRKRNIVFEIISIEH